MAIDLGTLLTNTAWGGITGGIIVIIALAIVFVIFLVQVIKARNESEGV